MLADAGQLEQVLMNFATNARDAMADGGLLTIEAELLELDEEYIKTHAYGEPGKYAVVSMTDTGAGMDEEVRKRIFGIVLYHEGVGQRDGTRPCDGVWDNKTAIRAISTSTVNSGRGQHLRSICRSLKQWLLRKQDRWNSRVSSAAWKQYF